MSSVGHSETAGDLTVQSIANSGMPCAKILRTTTTTTVVIVIGIINYIQIHI